MIISGHPGSDTGSVVLNTVTGVIMRTPGNRYSEVRRAAQIIKIATETNDSEFQKATIDAAMIFLNSKPVSDLLASDSQTVVFL